jgi:hypothetical protein
MKIATGIVVFGILIVALAIYQLQIQYTWPIARPRLNATWPMRPGMAEGFVDMPSALKAWLPSPETLTKAIGGGDCNVLYSAGSYEAGVGTPYKSYDLLPNGKPEPRVARGPTSQGCYQQDWSVGLEPGGSYAQCTNNYPRGYPDSCSAPNHDLILDFYKGGPIQIPKELAKNPV